MSAAKSISPQFKLCNVRALVIVVAAILVSWPANAVPKLFDGRIEIDRVLLLQDSKNPNDYYYVPPYPILARDSDGNYSLSVIRYVGGKEGKTGAVLSAVAEMRLPQDVEERLARTLMNQYGGRLVGSVQFTDPASDPSEDAPTPATFSVDTATIGDPNVTKLSSGSVPIGTGGRATIAATLSGDDANLLWGALQLGSATDIAFSMNAAYLAQIESYNAVVHAETNMVYRHLSELQNQQGGFSRDQVRDAVDELIRDQVLQVTESDTGNAFDITGSRGEALVKTITEKLVEVMFDTETGWASPPNTNPGPDDIKGRIAGGTISGSFFGIPGFQSGSMGYSENTEYVPDDQHVLKDLTEIRSQTFHLDFSRSQVIRVPYQSSGNLGSLFVRLNGNPRYFRTVDLADQQREESEVTFVIHSDFANAFENMFDSVSLDVRHGRNGDVKRFSKSMTAEAIKGSSRQFPPVVIKKPLSGPSDGWDSYRYRVSWNMRGSSQPIVVPADDEWVRGDSGMTVLAPPLDLTDVEVVISPAVFDSSDIRIVSVNLMSRLRGKAQILRTYRVLPETETGVINKFTIYHDPGATVAYRIDYMSDSGETKGSAKAVDSGVIFVGAPKFE